MDMFAGTPLGTSVLITDLSVVYFGSSNMYQSSISEVPTSEVS